MFKYFETAMRYLFIKKKSKIKKVNVFAEGEFEEHECNKLTNRIVKKRAHGDKS